MRLNGFSMVGVAILWIGVGAVGVTAGAAERAPATVDDGVDMTNVAFLGYMRGARPCGMGTDYESVATFSPHGRRFVVEEFIVRIGEGPTGPFGPVFHSSIVYWLRPRLRFPF